MLARMMGSGAEGRSARAECGWACALLLVLGACGAGEERCRGPADCALPEVCGSERRCTLPAPAPRGASCEHPAHCLSGACLDGGDGLVCVQPCDDAAACAADGEVCVPRPGRAPDETAPALRLRCAAAPAGAERFLGEACSGDEACRSGLCQAGVCSQPCGSCPALTSCVRGELQRGELGLGHDLCQPEPALRVVELGPLATPVEGEAKLRFELGADLVSAILVAEDLDGLRVGVRRLTAPDGTVLLDSASPATALVRAANTIGVATLLLPSGDDPRAAPKAGSYELVLGTFEPAVVDALVPVGGALERVALVLRQRQGGGLLDLNLNVAPGTGLTAATAPESDYAKGLLGRLDSLYRARFGVALGEVRWADLPASADALRGGDQVRALLSTAADSGRWGTAANLFVVKSLDFTAGYAGAIPGVPGLLGRRSSGIVLTKYADVETMGALAAHELGHFLGLWHTSEPEGTGAFDLLSDTPTCVLGTPRASCPDRGNLLFPSFVARGALEVSPGQAEVLRRSPWLYELAYPEVCGAGVPAVDTTQYGFASGSTADGSTGRLEGSCGGAQQPERVHLYRLPAQVGALDLEIRGFGFAPVVYVRRDPCGATAGEVVCAVGAADTPLPIKLPLPTAGAYYVVVDGVTAGGRYDLTLRTQPLAPPG